MKKILRAIIFSYIGVYLTQRIIYGFDFGGNENQTYFLLVFALALLSVCAPPVFKIISFPTKGVGFLVLNFIITLITIYVLTMLLPSFKIVDTTLSEVVLFGFVLPSKELSSIGALVYSALVFSVVFSFFNWLCTSKKR